MSVKNKENDLINKNGERPRQKVYRRPHGNMGKNKSALNRIVESKKSFYVYLSLALLRILLTILPQSGYIHPDEYFQSIEVIAGETFNVEHVRPWEFNRTNPIRSAAIPLLTVSLPYRLFKSIQFYLSGFLHIYIPPTPYLLTIFPRLFICLLSFLIDFSLYKICKITKVPFSKKLSFLASSYVILVFGTRTFSNTIEMILMSLLLYLVADSQQFSNSVISKYEFFDEKYRKTRIAVDRARYYKMKIFLPSHTMRNCIALSIITVTGFFNRPTFVFFAVIPIFFWLHRGLGCKSVGFAQFHLRMLVFLTYSFIMIGVYIIIDTFYYGHLTVMEVARLEISISNFVVTPLNFIRYNLNTENLAQHGLHSRWLHILVNIPLLYNVLGVVAIYGILILLYRLIKGRYTQLPHIHSIETLMILSIIAPVVGLSYFPHQEPRFLIPMLLPLVYLYSEYVIARKNLYKLWIMLNIFGLMFFGFVHQAGVYPASSHLHKQVANAQLTLKPIHLITSHVYNLPLSLIQHRNSKVLYGSGQTKYQKPTVFFLQEMGSNHLENTAKHLNVIYKITRNKEIPPDVCLLMPTSRYSEMERHVNEYNMTLETVRVFYPHLSTEALPDLVRLLDRFVVNYDFIEFVHLLLKSCGLGLYNLTRLY